MEDVRALENMIDSTTDYLFFGMKTLAAGALEPEMSFSYFSQHNICAVSIGQVDVKLMSMKQESLRQLL